MIVGSFRKEMDKGMEAFQDKDGEGRKLGER